MEQVRAYTVGLDSWEVWICDTTNGGLVSIPTNGVVVLERRARSLLLWLSDSKYRPAFTPGGTVSVGQTGWPSTRSTCRPNAAIGGRTATGTAQGALIVVDVPYAGGFATPGVWCEGLRRLSRPIPRTVAGPWSGGDGGLGGREPPGTANRGP
jgi:hypothetical protein